jgi:DNA polymerase III subunit gamma/tau
MGYQVTARKWRPQTFDDVVEQHHVTRTLRNAIRLGRIAHAYLFAGTRGVGKTTMARVLAKALNCECGPTETPCNTCQSCLEITQGTSMDIVEIDGASNRGIDEIRDLRERLRYLPARGRYKVYILDEVHMLTKEAFNALLKTLEEPPAHVVFVFATTEIERIPYTIVSRCQRFEFKRVSLAGLTAQLEHITQSESIRISRACLMRIAKAAEGSMRDAQSLLDQVVAYCGMEVRDEDVDQLLGYVGIETLAQCLGALLQQDAAVALHMASVLQSEGHEAAGIARALLEGLRHLIVLKTVPRPEDLIPLSETDIETLRAVAELASVEEIYGQFHVLSAAEQTLRHANNPFLGLEMTLVRMACIGRVHSLQTILEHLQRLETDLPAVSAPSALAAPQEERPAAVLARPARNGQGEDTKTSARGAGTAVGTVASRVSDMPLSEAPQSEVPTTAESAWDALQQRVSGPLAGHMQCGRPLTLDEHRLVVGFAQQYKFALDHLLEQPNKVVVNDAARAIFGRPLRIDLELCDAGAAGINGASGTEAAAEPEAGALEEIQRHKNELKQAVIDIFGATPI